MNRNSEEVYEHPDFSELRNLLPPYLSRKHPKFKEYTGYSPKSFANMDSRSRHSGLKGSCSEMRLPMSGRVWLHGWRSDQG
jgi:hypothetical protein